MNYKLYYPIARKKLSSFEAVNVKKNLPIIFDRRKNEYWCDVVSTEVRKRDRCSSEGRNEIDSLVRFIRSLLPLVFMTMNIVYASKKEVTI